MIDFNNATITNVYRGTTQVQKIYYGTSLVYILPTDSDAQAFITATGITDAIQIEAIDNLVVGLKDDGLWIRLDAIYPMVGGTETAHKFNLKNPADTNAAYRLSFNGGWTHSATGALPNGTNAWANTHYVPSGIVDGLPNTLGYYSRTNGGSGYELGIDGASSDTNLAILAGSSQINFAMASANALGGSPGDTRAWYMVNRTTGGGTTIAVRRNTTQVASTTLSIQTSYVTRSLYLGARNTDSTGTAKDFTAKECAFAVLGWQEVLSSTQRTNLYNRIQTFQTTLGRQV